MDICRSVAVLSVVLFVNFANAVAADISIAERDVLIEKSRTAWNKFLAENCSAKDTEQKIRKLVNGKYREMAITRPNKETYGLLFLIDDFHQVKFGFDAKDSKLISVPRIEPKGQWLQMPSGNVASIPYPAEIELKSKVTKAAIDYIVKHKNHKRDFLDAHCERSDNPKIWNVCVAVNTLELDSPAYVLEVTDDGVVMPRNESHSEGQKRAVPK